MSATARLLAGNRLHLNYGPIDLVIGADGEASAVERAYRAAVEVFPAILPALVAELPFLRSPILPEAPPLYSCHPGACPRDPSGHNRRPSGSGAVGPGNEGRDDTCRVAPSPAHQEIHPIARAMYAAVWPYRAKFVTPMAAVAGSVADHVLGVMLAAAPLVRAYVNNGGDIALHLATGEAFAAGVVGDIARPAIDARAVITVGDGIGGIATSGWRGRSQSLGIADAVTILARDAATADAAATMIANAVDIDHPAVERRPARTVKDDSDLGDLAVTVGVGTLEPAARRQALAAGEDGAREILIHGLIVAAYIQLQGEMVVVGGSRLAAEAA